MRIVELASAIAICVSLAPLASADDAYPNKTIRMVVPFPPGGTSDFVGRVVAEQLGRDLNQTIVVENLPGAAGAIGTVNVAQAAPDGYTLLLTSSDLTIVPTLQRRPAYDAGADFEPVALLMRYPHYLVASKDFPGGSVADVIRMSQEEPGSINYASGGIGGSNHMAAERFQSVAGIELTHVPYNGNGPAITDLVADRVQLLWTSLAPVAGFVDAGDLKLIGVSSAQRTMSKPDVPTFAESGLPGYELTNWYGVFAPKGTPAAIVETLNGALVAAMSEPGVVEKLTPIGAVSGDETPAEFGVVIGQEVLRWREIAEAANLTVN